MRLLSKCTMARRMGSLGMILVSLRKTKLTPDVRYAPGTIDAVQEGLDDTVQFVKERI